MACVWDQGRGNKVCGSPRMVSRRLQLYTRLCFLALPTHRVIANSELGVGCYMMGHMDGAGK